MIPLGFLIYTLLNEVI